MSLQTSLTNYALAGCLEWSEVAHLLEVEAKDIQEAIKAHDRDLALQLTSQQPGPIPRAGPDD